MNKHALAILGSLTVVIYGIILIYTLNPSGVKTKKLSDRLLGKQYIGISFDSMTPTINRRANVKMDAYHYVFNPLRRNEIIAYSGQYSIGVSRIVGLEGDVVSIRKGKLYVNQREVNQPYVDIEKLRAEYSLKMKAYTVPKNTVLVLADSRRYRSYTLKISRIFGKVMNIPYQPFFASENTEPHQEDVVADTATQQEETIAHTIPHKKEETVIRLYLKIPKSAGGSKPNSPDGGIDTYSRPATIVQERDCALMPDQVSLYTINLEQQVLTTDLKRMEIEKLISQATLNRDKYKNQMQEKIQKLYPRASHEITKNMMSSQALDEELRIKDLQIKLREVKIKKEKYINIKQGLDKSELCDVPVELAGQAK